MPVNRATGRSQRHQRYATPDNITVLSLRQLLGDRRAFDDTQQRRLGLDGADAQGPRLWCAGEPSLVQKCCVSIVGTREVSDEGAARARKLARQLAAKGIVVVSGLARGVDTAALTAAIESGGRVIAVIGTPIDRAYPAENAGLQQEIARGHLVISQFPSGVPVYKGNFPERNKLMAALTDATVIIEAGDTSGTLHQAAECVRLGRRLFIAKSTMDNPDLHWPAKFRPYPNVATMSSVEDVLDSLAGCR